MKLFSQNRAFFQPALQNTTRGGTVAYY